jgi:AcrR family transcriptional regulator
MSMRKGEQTRERVLAQAAQVFNQRGFFGASLADLMQATGLQKGGIYNHFESKEALALEAFDYALALIDQQFREALVDKRTARERLLAMIGVFRSFAENPPVRGGCPVMNTAIESDDAYPLLRDRARQAMDQWRALIQRIVERGIASGELKSTVNGDELASLLIATLEGGVMLSKLYHDPVHIHRAADHMTTYIDQLMQS